MPTELAIVPISESNFNAFLELLECLAEYEHLAPPDEHAKARLRRDGLVDQPKYFAYLGILSDQPIGYLIFFMTYSSFLALPTLYIEDIFILEEHRRKGYGQQMFDFAIAEAKARSCGRAEWCVLTWNTPAIRFYEKNKAKKLDWYFYRFDRDRLEEK